MKKKTTALITATLMLLSVGCGKVANNVSASQNTDDYESINIYIGTTVFDNAMDPMVVW